MTLLKQFLSLKRCYYFINYDIELERKQMNSPAVVALTVRAVFSAVIGRAGFVVALLVVAVVFFAAVDVTPA